MFFFCHQDKRPGVDDAIVYLGFYGVLAPQTGTLGELILVLIYEYELKRYFFLIILSFVFTIIMYT